MSSPGTTHSLLPWALNRVPGALWTNGEEEATQGGCTAAMRYDGPWVNLTESHSKGAEVWEGMHGAWGMGI